MMTIITAKRRRERTRFVLGCPDRAADLEQKLKALGYVTRHATTHEKVERADEERTRATRIINELLQEMA